MTRIKEYFPALAMVLAAALSFLATALLDNKLDAGEVGMTALLVLGAVNVYIVPRFTTVGWLKPAVAFTYAGLELLLTFLTDGITTSEIIQVILAGLGAIGVVATNKEVPLTATRPRT